MIRGASESLVTHAIETTDPFPGTNGFAGQLPDGRLVRDVLGRVPLFVDRSGASTTEWAFDPTDLHDPEPVPPGTVVGPAGPETPWPLPDPDPRPEGEALQSLRDAIDRTLAEVDTDGLAVAFSGGIDSALLAAVLDVPLYTVGFPDGHDVAAARSVADALGTTTSVRELTATDLEAVVPTVARVIGRTNAMDVPIATSLYLVAEAAADDGFERLALGQGADELFGGYAKIAKADHRVDAETVRGARWEVLSAIHSGLTRDTLAIRAAGLDPVMPYLHDRVVEAALALPESLLVEDGVRKRGFRVVAADTLPDAVVDRQKKAIQYGSLVSRELDRLARQAGFKRRMDDHVGQYVRQRVADDSR